MSGTQGRLGTIRTAPRFVSPEGHGGHAVSTLRVFPRGPLFSCYALYRLAGHRRSPSLCRLVGEPAWLACDAYELGNMFVVPSTTGALSDAPEPFGKNVRNGATHEQGDGKVAAAAKSD